jgi:hypothetical protein
MHGGRGLVSIWFFIGVLLLIYGVIIFASAFLVTPAHEVVLARLRADIWWGALLLIIGGLYTWLFRPGRR